MQDVGFFPAFWNADSGDNDRVSAGDTKPHSSQIQGLGLVPGASGGSLQLISVGMDDLLKHAGLEKHLFRYFPCLSLENIRSQKVFLY
jgi:hypothetical protein